MKVFSVIGFSGSGKTTSIENIIMELKRRGYSVGAVKQCHHRVKTDIDGTNSDRMRLAGASLVTAISRDETHVFYQRPLSMSLILSLYDQDFVVLEGSSDINVPAIITAQDTAGIDKKLCPGVFAVSGVIASRLKEYKGYPVICSIKETKKIVDLIVKTVPEIPQEKFTRIVPEEDKHDY
ncbi:MAG: molybdopterin-guanine dinucleotide biosynthesis protein B [Spirochaetia bacterium]|jgi:molybdopterin-guanine dinucleotide biosynthesis protein B|nr:molybdopterin-guanine dinucleotide biosynthesis protein B [Spirochaetia bacterium]